MLSAMVSASAYRRSISFWPGPASWCEYSTEMPICSSMFIHGGNRRKSMPRLRGTWSKQPPRRSGSGLGPAVLAFEQVELDFRMHVEREALSLVLASVRFNT